MKAVILCGGAATRMRPVTETIPKPLLKVAGITVLDIIVAELLKNGVDDLYLTLGFMADEIINHVDMSSYSEYVKYIREDVPLGTAGGVRNALENTDEDIIVVCGDNVFNFDIDDILKYHNKSFADFTIAAVECEETSEYGVITADDDGSIVRFSEKPLPGENESNLVNTGFYIVGKNAFELIPKDRFFDFSNDLFPLLLSGDYKLHCYRTDGYWGDIGDFESYISVNADFLRGITGIQSNFDGTLFEHDIQYGGSKIIAPVLISKTASIGTQCIIGPNTYIGEDCIIGDGAKIENTICMDNSSVGLRSEVSHSVLCEQVTIGAYVGVDKHCAFGEGAIVENYCKIDEATRVWPRVRITENTRASKNVFCKPAVSAFFMSTLSGTVFSEISCSDVLQLGQSAASIKDISKIGISGDGKKVTQLLINLFSSGVLASGANIYNFGSSFLSQSSFFASYCSLDLAVFISVDDSTANFSFTGKNGLPVNASLLKKLRSILKFSGFKKVSPSCVSSEYEMSLISEIYSSFLFNEIKGKLSFEYCVICSNNALAETLEYVLTRSGCKKGMGGMRIFINDEGTRMYIQDNERVYSSEEMLCACAQREYEKGNGLVLSDDAPEMLDLLASEYGLKNERIYSVTDNKYSDEALQAYRENRWVYDCLFLVCKFVSIMCTEQKTMDEIMNSVPRFSSKKFNLDLNINSAMLPGLMSSVGAVKEDADVFYKLKNDSANARIRVSDRAGRLRILIEAKNSEIAKEFAHDITMRINKEIKKKEK